MSSVSWHAVPIYIGTFCRSPFDCTGFIRFINSIHIEHRVSIYLTTSPGSNADFIFIFDLHCLSQHVHPLFSPLYALFEIRREGLYKALTQIVKCEVTLEFEDRCDEKTTAIVGESVSFVLAAKIPSTSIQSPLIRD